MVTTLVAFFVFAADGCIHIFIVNSPGSWHDSAQADYGVYQGMKEVYEIHVGKVVVYSTFNLKNYCDHYLINISQQYPRRLDLYYKNNEAISVRQLLERGMRMIQAQFPRLKDKLSYEEAGERRIILNLMVLIYNFQCSTIGHNEILNSYMNDKLNFFGSYDMVPTSEANLNVINHRYN